MTLFYISQRSRDAYKIELEKLTQKYNKLVQDINVKAK